ncbi:hypothetical protein KTJ32_15930 [Acinetobacter gyllenbergii]|uniref:hypothetical protein n=1 Tax=Acinetobacter gyllenbergii TaxID=134534 RepID=UPI0021CE1FAD|nr:hypothetical protein [Acinetobacter gyllenbergii]MCU4582483.1 hypothetical protein [Acinetobacter gyllenbergii]
MDNYNLIIKDKDLFDLFFNKVPYIWQALDYSVKQDRAREPVCLYKESVRVIQAFDKFMEDLRSGSLPPVSQLGVDATGHAEYDHSFLRYFNALQFEHGMFDLSNLHLGLNWTYYQKFLEEDAIKLSSNTSGIELVPFNSDGLQVQRQQWSPSKFQNQKAWRLINFFSELQKNLLYIEKKDKKTRQVIDEINHAFAHFDSLLSIQQEVYILLIDVRFVRAVNQANSQSLDQLIEQVLRDRSAIHNTFFQVIPSLLRAYTKLEHDYQHGLKLSCILILRNHNIDQEEGFVARLQVLLKDTFGHYDAIEAINGNEFVRTHGKKYAVGRVGINTAARIEQFKYWVLSNFIKVDSFAKLIHTKMPFEVNATIDHQNWQQPEIKKQALSSKKIPLPKNLAQIVQEWKAPKRIWDVKHLAHRVADRLLVSQIYYNEFCAEQGLSKHYGELLFQIEAFIETLLHNRQSAFNEMRSIHQNYFLSVRDIQTSTTQLGQQYLSLVKQVESDLSFWGAIDHLIQNCGLRTWWFGHEDHLILWNSFQQLFKDPMFNQSVDAVVLGQMNRNLQNVRSYFIAKQPPEVDKRKLLEKHYAQCVRRQKDTREYLNSVLEQNCWTYRIMVDARSSKGNFTQPELSKLFTEFMRLAKRAKPCYWLRGYMGIWQEKNWNGLSEFTLDLVLFFSDRCQEQLQTVVHELHRRWNNFLISKAAQTLELKDVEDIKYDGSINPKKLMCSIDVLNTDHDCLEEYDRKMKKMFIEHVIPYFVYRDIFQPPFSQTVPKAFIKGAMLKK